MMDKVKLFAVKERGRRREKERRNKCFIIFFSNFLFLIYSSFFNRGVWDASCRLQLGEERSKQAFVLPMVCSGV